MVVLQLRSVTKLVTHQAWPYHASPAACAPGIRPVSSVDTPVRSIGTADFDGKGRRAAVAGLAGTVIDQPAIEPELVGAVRLEPVHLEVKRVGRKIGPEVALRLLWIDVAVSVLAGVCRQEVQARLKVIFNAQRFGKRLGFFKSFRTANF